MHHELTRVIQQCERTGLTPDAPDAPTAVRADPFRSRFVKRDRRVRKEQ
jgi:hypothetical protein